MEEHIDSDIEMVFSSESIPVYRKFLPKRDSEYKHVTDFTDFESEEAPYEE